MSTVDDVGADAETGAEVAAVASVGPRPPLIVGDELAAAEVRVLGALMEKAATTPDAYPLSTNALVTACNQKSNRTPVVSYGERLVDATMIELRQRGLCRTIHRGRSNKHRHIVGEAWGLSDRAVAVLAVLCLRGPQTVGELHQRTERYEGVAGFEDADGGLDELVDAGFAVMLPKAPGAREARHGHLLSGAPAAVSEADDHGEAITQRRSAVSELTERVETLEAEVVALRAQVAGLLNELGVG